VFSVDEKSQIKALDWTQPALPMKPGKNGTMTQDDKRHGTNTLSAALDVHVGTVIGECLQQHRHDEFLKFLKRLDRHTDKTLAVHGIVDNYATHRHPNVKTWLAKHQRLHLHFTPNSASWLNLVERFFRDITEERIRRGVFHSVADLEQAIMDYLDYRNANPKPYHWTAAPDAILTKVAKAYLIVDEAQLIRKAKAVLGALCPHHPRLCRGMRSELHSWQERSNRPRLASAAPIRRPSSRVGTGC
jgi:transposase